MVYAFVSASEHTREPLLPSKPWRAAKQRTSFENSVETQKQHRQRQKQQQQEQAPPYAIYINDDFDMHGGLGESGARVVRGGKQWMFGYSDVR